MTDGAPGNEEIKRTIEAVRLARLIFGPRVDPSAHPIYDEEADAFDVMRHFWRRGYQQAKDEERACAVAVAPRARRRR